MEEIRSSQTPVYIQPTPRYIPEDGNIHNYRCENFRYYTMGNVLKEDYEITEVRLRKFTLIIFNV
jgi:hypothetical protein